MQLHEMIYARLVTDEALSGLLARYDDRAAVFYQRAATADDPKWNAQAVDADGAAVVVQYPRINYMVDLQENPERNASGSLTLNVWCDTQYGVEPEVIEERLRTLLHAAFVQTDDWPYCLAWFRSDAFEIKSQSDETVRTYGVTVMFDLMACPCEYTMDPDPIKGLNRWTKEILPDAVVIGEDDFEGWLVPTREKPVIYWRLSELDIRRQTFTLTWLNLSCEGHVYGVSAADRLVNLTKLQNAAALAHHVALEDTSPLFLESFDIQPRMNYTAVGQIRVRGWFGLNQPEAHFVNGGTGEGLDNARTDENWHMEP